MACNRTYEFVLKTPMGIPIAPITDAIKVRWVLRENKPGTLSVTLPNRVCGAGGWSLGDFGEDYLIDVWRNVNGTRKLLSGSSFFVQELYSQRDANGQRTIQVECDDAKVILARHLVAYDSQDFNQDYNANLVGGPETMPLDEMLKRLYERSFSPAESYYNLGGEPERRLQPQWLEVNLTTLGTGAASVTLSNFEVTAHKTVQAVFNQVLDFAASKNEPLFFDVTLVDPYGATANPLMRLNIYQGLRGVDRTSSVFLSDHDAVVDYKIGVSWRETARRVTAGGKNSGSAQNYGHATSPDYFTANATNPWSVREFYTAGSSNDPVDLVVTAQAELQKRLARMTATGKLADTMSYNYGVDYEFGDKIRVGVEDQVFDVFLDSEEGVLENGGEVLSVGFNSDANGYIGAPLAVSSANQTVFEIGKRIRLLEAQLQYQATLFGV